MDASFRAVPTPCTGVCTLDDQGRCYGCLRSTEEIGRWLQMSDDQRRHLMEVVLPARQAARA